MNNRIKMTDSKFKCNIFLFLSVTVFMARLSIYKHPLLVSKCFITKNPYSLPGFELGTSGLVVRTTIPASRQPTILKP
jgi:hypothetical protein